VIGLLAQKVWVGRRRSPQRMNEFGGGCGPRPRCSSWALANWSASAEQSPSRPRDEHGLQTLEAHAGQPEVAEDIAPTAEAAPDDLVLVCLAKDPHSDRSSEGAVPLAGRGGRRKRVDPGAGAGLVGDALRWLAPRRGRLAGGP
jgi:hypothetical protein